MSTDENIQILYIQILTGVEGYINYVRPRGTKNYPTLSGNILLILYLAGQYFKTVDWSIFFR